MTLGPGSAGEAIPAPPDQPAAPIPSLSAGDVAVGGAWLLAGTLVGQAMLVVVTLFLAKKFGADRYGLYALATAVVIMVQPLAAVGLPNTVVRFVANAASRHDRHGISGALVSSVLLSLIGSAAVAVVVIALAPWISSSVVSEPRLTSLLRWACVALPFLVLLELVSAFARALGQMAVASVCRAARAIALLLLVIGLAGVDRLTPTTAVVLYGLAALVAVVFAVGLGARRAAPFMARPPRFQMRVMARYGGPLVASTLLYAIWPRVDRLVVGSIFDTATVGIYALVVSIAININLVHENLVGAFLPALAERHFRGDQTAAARLFRTVTRIDTAVAFPIVLVAVLLWHDVLSAVGPGFVRATGPGIILSIAIYVGITTGPTEGLLSVTDRQKLEAFNSGLALFVGLIAEIVLGNVIVLPGIACATLFASLLLNGLHLFQINRYYGYHPYTRDHIVFVAVTLVVLIVAGFLGRDASAGVRLAFGAPTLVIYAVVAWRRERVELLELVRSRRAAKAEQ
jgi:stage V sporulation protein B